VQPTGRQNMAHAPVMAVLRSVCPCPSVHTTDSRQVLIANGCWCSNIPFLDQRFHHHENTQSVTSSHSSPQTSSPDSSSNQAYPQPSYSSHESLSFHPQHPSPSYAATQHTNEHSARPPRLHKYRPPQISPSPTNSVGNARVHRISLPPLEDVTFSSRPAYIVPPAPAIPASVPTNVALDHSRSAVTPDKSRYPRSAPQAVNTRLPQKPRVSYETRPHVPSHRDAYLDPPYTHTPVKQDRLLQHASDVLQPPLQPHSKNIWAYPSPEFPVFVPSPHRANVDSAGASGTGSAAIEGPNMKRYTVQARNPSAPTTSRREVISGHGHVVQPDQSITPHLTMPAIGSRFAAAGTHPSQMQDGLSRLKVRSGRIFVDSNLDLDTRSSFERQKQDERRAWGRAWVRRVENTNGGFDREHKAAETTLFDPVVTASSTTSSFENGRLQYTKRLAPVYSNTRQRGVSTIRTGLGIPVTNSTNSSSKKLNRPETNALKLRTLIYTPSYMSFRKSDSFLTYFQTSTPRSNRLP
jgi:hypothetical protein